jgi:AcrR family transcriptional regulator
VTETLPDRRARRSAATRAEIVAAAWQIARERGLAGLALRDVAARVGMRAPSLYSYFTSKNDLYDAMFADGYAQAERALSGAGAHLPPVERLHAIARAFVAFSQADPARYQLLFQRTVPGFTPSTQSYAAALRFLEEGRAALHAAGVTEPRHLDLWTAVLTGLTDQQISNEPGGRRWAGLVDEAVDMLLTHVARRNP